ncbi:hypothetical protein PMAYCL1PPCAC_28974 [Pristionchus mayeri]|uniref:Uncharacterized protein n=1 Tax=Pristionchus mayeri TaxID=1317129 RepID=A0AAN5DB91_9BILA|nr:hypothetical protein PMAYCL1PPCAC_28974 [Pristionchus mayeri]
MPTPQLACTLTDICKMAPLLSTHRGYKREPLPPHPTVANMPDETSSTGDAEAAKGHSPPNNEVSDNITTTQPGIIQRIFDWIMGIFCRGFSRTERDAADEGGREYSRVQLHSYHGHVKRPRPQECSSIV